MATVAKLAVAAATYAIDKPYDYAIPEELESQVKIGVRVVIPFGRGNRTCEGIVLDICDGSDRKQLKPIRAVLDEEPILTCEQRKLIFWMCGRYFCTLYEAMRAVLPPGLLYTVEDLYVITAEGISLPEQADTQSAAVLEKLVAMGGSATAEALTLCCGFSPNAALKALCQKGLVIQQTTAKKRVKDKQRWRITLEAAPDEAMAVAAQRKNSAPLRYAAIKFLAETGNATAGDIMYYTGCSLQTLRGLEKRGLVSFSREEVLRVPQHRCAEAPAITLNQEQQEAVERILGRADGTAPCCSLLYGVTGSGKTEVYLRLLQKIVERGQQGILLVPEIALTPQMLARFAAHFGDRVALLHSRLSLCERTDQWKRIRRGEVDVVLGTRSAVFAPLERLGMLILDEEHEESYQSENAPPYHAREVAKFRCGYHNAALVLGSATPSVESTYQAQQGVYQKLALRQRYNSQPLPKVMIVDLRQELAEGNGGTISRALHDEIAANLRRGEQTILFLNRRGNSRMLLCGECGHVPECPRCSVPLTYHSANGRMMCHYCGYSHPAQSTCGCCGGEMKPVGIGTQKVEEELLQRFPDAELLRMDADTVAGDHQRILDRFAKGEVPILLGTQMVAKGLHFENVTLVGALAADFGLYADSFRAAERTFDLLTQVVGRAGRGSKDGRAVIQTYHPDHEVIAYAAAQDYNGFYASEIRIRRARCDPPFADLFMMTVSGLEEGMVLRSITRIRRSLQEAMNREEMGELVGPAPAPVVRVNGWYHYRLFLVGKNDHRTRQLLSHYRRMFYEQKENRGLHLFITCNPGG